MCYAYPGSIPASPVNGSNITQAAIGVKHLVTIPLIVAGRPSPLGRLQLLILGCGCPYPGVERDSRGG